MADTNAQGGSKNGIFSADRANATEFNAQGGVVRTPEGQLFKYNVKQHVYPEKTGDANAGPDLQHFLVFYINVRGKSKFKKDYKTVEIQTGAEQRMDAKRVGEATNGILTVGAVAAGAKMGASATSKLTGLFAKNVPSSVRALGTLGGLIAGGTAGAVAANYFEPDKTFRTSTAIMLAVQERPSVSYGVNYQQQDMGSLAGFIAGGSSAVDSGYKEAGGEAMRAMLLNVAQIPAGITNAIGATDLDIKALASIGTGTAMNPFREQVFKSVDPRTFDFNYKFVPRSLQESRNVWEIIEEFKFHMHPELAGGGLFYIYPSTFNIEYYFSGDMNHTVHRISTCVLQNMTVDYGGQQFASLVPAKGLDGSNPKKNITSYPAEVNMKLRFVELETLTKERINKGY